MNFSRTLLILSMCIWMNSPALSATAEIPNYVSAALHAPGRPADEIERDAAMKPADVLVFAGIKPGQDVAELMPGAGYYTRILSGIVGPKGHVYAVVATGAGQGPSGGGPGPLTKDPNQSQPLSRVALAYTIEDQPEFKKNVTVFWEGLGTGLSVPAQLDAVVAAGAFHTLKGADFAKLDSAAVAKNIFNAMKNGGTLLVIDNKAAKGANAASAAALNRVDPDALSAELTAAGFVLDAQSDLLSRSDEDGSKAADDNAPSDMFVLRFKKPANAPRTDKRPPNVIQAMSGYFGNTRRGNVGDKQERRVLYHEDMTYEEYGAKGAGNSPFQSGIWFFNANGEGCMLHEFPANQRAQTICSLYRATPYKKVGDKWFGDDNHPMEVVKGYVYFDDATGAKN